MCVTSVASKLSHAVLTLSTAVCRGHKNIWRLAYAVKRVKSMKQQFSLVNTKRFWTSKYIYISLNMVQQKCEDFVVNLQS